MTDYYYRGPSVDHSLLSPSGKMSKRARAEAVKRETARLFKGVQWENAPSPERIKAERVATLRRSAANLRDLADRGMSPRKYRRNAARLEREADDLEAIP